MKVEAIKRIIERKSQSEEYIRNLINEKASEGKISEENKATLLDLLPKEINEEEEGGL